MAEKGQACHAGGHHQPPSDLQLGGRSHKLVVQRSGCLCHCGEEGGTESSDCQTAGSVAPGPPCEPCWGTGRLEPGLS